MYDWTECSKKLPDEDDDGKEFMITARVRYCNGDTEVVVLSTYWCDGEWDETNLPDILEVIAWKPWPKPYRVNR